MDCSNWIKYPWQVVSYNDTLERESASDWLVVVPFVPSVGVAPGRQVEQVWNRPSGLALWHNCNKANAMLQSMSNIMVVLVGYCSCFGVVFEAWKLLFLFFCGHSSGSIPGSIVVRTGQALQTRCKLASTRGLRLLVPLPPSSSLANVILTHNTVVFFFGGGGHLFKFDMNCFGWYRLVNE